MYEEESRVILHEEIAVAASTADDEFFHFAQSFFDDTESILGNDLNTLNVPKAEILTVDDLLSALQSDQVIQFEKSDEAIQDSRGELFADRTMVDLNSTLDEGILEEEGECDNKQDFDFLFQSLPSSDSEEGKSSTEDAVFYPIEENSLSVELDVYPNDFDTEHDALVEAIALIRAEGIKRLDHAEATILAQRARYEEELEALKKPKKVNTQATKAKRRRGKARKAAKNSEIVVEIPISAEEQALKTEAENRWRIMIWGEQLARYLSDVNQKGGSEPQTSITSTFSDYYT